MKTDEQLLSNFRIEVEGNLIKVLVFAQEPGPQDYIRTAELSKNICFDIFKKYPGTVFNFLVDIGKNDIKSFPREAGRQFQAIAEHKQVDKTAMVTTELMIKMITNTISYLSGKSGKIKCFATRSAALEWLREDNE